MASARVKEKLISVQTLQQPQDQAHSEFKQLHVQVSGRRAFYQHPVIPLLSLQQTTDARKPLQSYCTRLPFHADQDGTSLRSSAAPSSSSTTTSPKSSPEKSSSLFFHQLPMSRSLSSQFNSMSSFQTSSQSFIYNSESPRSRQQSNMLTYATSSSSPPTSFRDTHSLTASALCSRQKGNHYPLAAATSRYGQQQWTNYSFSETAPGPPYQAVKAFSSRPLTSPSYSTDFTETIFSPDTNGQI